MLRGPFKRRSRDAGWSVLRSICLCVSLQFFFLYDDAGWVDLIRCISSSGTRSEQPQTNTLSSLILLFHRWVGKSSRRDQANGNVRKAAGPEANLWNWWLAGRVLSANFEGVVTL